MKIIQIVIIAVSALVLSQMAYADHDGTDSKHCDHKNAMQDADTNKDGVISHDEFTAYHKKMADEMFAKMDTNNDGKIDQAERQAAKDKMGKNCKMKDHKMHDMEQEPPKK